MTSLLSVIMPTHNGEKFVAAALESVRAQSSEEIELIVVDDGSSDGTLEIVRNFSNTLPVRLITPGRIGSWVAVSNLGLREATGEWACFLHQDDLWLPGRIAKLRPEMQQAQTTTVILHNASFVGPDGRKLGPWTCPLQEGLVPPDEFVEHLLIQNFIAILSPVFRRKAAIDSGGLDESLWFSADWDLWLRLGAMSPVRFIAETLAAFRIHPASQTAARKVHPNEWKEQLMTVLNRHLPQWQAAREEENPANRVSAARYGKVVERVAKVSITVNSALSAASRGKSAEYLTVALKLLALGPAGWPRYLRDSRIHQRVASRLKLQCS